MRIPFYVLGFGFALSVAFVTAQTTQQPKRRRSTQARRQTGWRRRPNQVWNPGAPSTTAPSATGGVSGSASSSTGQGPDVQSSTSGISTPADPDLESQIQNALSKEPTLTGDSAHVTVSGDTIELAGRVGTNKEKVTATRIVQSYAGSKRLVNRLTVGKGSEKTSPQAPSTDKADGDRQPGTANPASNPEPGKSNPPSTSRPPQL